MAEPINHRPRSLREFYPLYQAAHAEPRCALLHYVGATAVVLGLVAIVLFQAWWWLLALPVIGYGLGWLGHVRYGKNLPLTIHHPLYSFFSYWMMYWAWLRRLVARSGSSNPVNRP